MLRFLLYFGPIWFFLHVGNLGYFFVSFRVNVDRAGSAKCLCFCAVYFPLATYSFPCPQQPLLVSVLSLGVSVEEISFVHKFPWLIQYFPIFLFSSFWLVGKEGGGDMGLFGHRTRDTGHGKQACMQAGRMDGWNVMGWNGMGWDGMGCNG